MKTIPEPHLHSATTLTPAQLNAIHFGGDASTPMAPAPKAAAPKAPATTPTTPSRSRSVPEGTSGPKGAVKAAPTEKPEAGSAGSLEINL